MSDGITDARRKVSEKVEFLGHFKYIEALHKELGQAIASLKTTLDINKEKE